MTRAAGSAGPRGQLVGVQYLRALAALAVAYYHCAIQVPALTPFFTSDLGMQLNFAAGVDVFFVISGFIMYVTGRKLGPVDFWLRRLVRIVPLYWILTLTIAVLVALAPALFRTTAVNSQYLLKSLLFIPYQNPGHGADVVPILVPGWSLNMEMMFYLIFGLLLLAPRARLLPIATAVFGLLVLTHFLLGPDGPPVARFLTDLRITEFFLGMLIGALYVASNLRPWRILLAILLTGSVAVLLWQPGVTQGAVISFVLATIIPSAAVVYAVVEWEKHYGAPAIPGLLALGNASYSLYLGHILALGVARAVWSHAGPKAASVATAVGFAVFGLALSVLVAIGLYRMLERPLTRELHRRLLPA